MAASSLLLLPLLLSVGLSRVPALTSANKCASDVVLRDGEKRTVKTEDVKNGGVALGITTSVYVKPDTGFQGVVLWVENESGSYHTAWFPLLPTDHQCLPMEGEWGEMKIGAYRHKIAPLHLYFWLRFGGCIKQCEDTSMELKRLRNLGVVGYGKSQWRRTKPHACNITVVQRATSPVTSICLQHPPEETPPPSITTTHHPPTTTFSSSTTPAPHPSSYSAFDEGTKTPDGTVLVMWVVGVVMVTIVVVTVVVVVVVVVVWRKRRRRSDVSRVISWISQPAPPSSHSHVTENCLYEAVNDLRNRQ